MAHAYLEDVRKIVDALPNDEGSMLEEKLILLGIVIDHVTEVTKELEDELDMCRVV
jgi:hypothetical protein